MFLEDRPNLQLSLDMLNLDEAIRAAIEVDDYVDIIGAGTTLIHNNGFSAINQLKARFSYKPVTADLKIVDAAEIEVGIASLAQADLVTVLATAPIDTIHLAVRRAHRCGLRVILDLLGIRDLENTLPELERASPDFLLVHTGLDQQHVVTSSVEQLELLAPKTHLAVGIAGVFQPEDVIRIRDIPNLGLVVVGNAITSKTNMVEAAREFRAAMNR